jgi:hypothetical protein
MRKSLKKIIQCCSKIKKKYMTQKTKSHTQKKRLKKEKESSKRKPDCVKHDNGNKWSKPLKIAYKEIKKKHYNHRHQIPQKLRASLAP